MNDLTPSNLPRKPISPELSTAVSRLLDEPGADLFAPGRIASEPALREEVRRALPALRAVATHKAGKTGIMEILGRRFALYPQPARSDEMWAAWWSDYFEALGDVTYTALDAAMVAWVADPDSEFLPKPGKLLELAMRTPNAAHRRYARAAKAMEICGHAERADAEPIPPPSAEEVAQVRKMLAGYQQKMAMRDIEKPVRPPMPNTAGKPDAGGLTAEMRALLAQQNGPRP